MRPRPRRGGGCHFGKATVEYVDSEAQQRVSRTTDEVERTGQQQLHTGRRRGGSEVPQVSIGTLRWYMFPRLCVTVTLCAGLGGFWGLLGQYHDVIAGRLG